MTIGGLGTAGAFSDVLFLPDLRVNLISRKQARCSDFHCGVTSQSHLKMHIRRHVLDLGRRLAILAP
jgi:hypothetical protein